MVSSTWADGLTEEQVIAASHTGSHARLLAGPGTGKSHTLSRRILFLIKETGIKPSEILVLAFTRIAVRDLRKSISRQLQEYSDDLPYIATIHSFALRQLMRNALIITDLPQPFRIADDWEERWIIYEDLKDLLAYDVGKVKGKFAELSADWETLQLDPSSGQPNRADPKFVGAWQQHRRTYGYTLRAELVYQLKRSLEQVASFNLEPGFKHLLVDEYQDLNPCELSVIKAISDRGPLVMACGDDDQSIYHFQICGPKRNKELH